MCEASGGRTVTWCIKACIDIVAMRHQSMPANANCSVRDLIELALVLDPVRKNRPQLICCSDPCYLSANYHQVSAISHDQRHSVRLVENPYLAGMRLDTPCPFLGMSLYNGTVGVGGYRFIFYSDNIDICFDILYNRYI